MKNSNGNFKLMAASIMTAVFSLVACQDEAVVIDNPGEFINALPQQVSYPVNNPYSEEKETLGRLLYWDPILSGTKDVAVCELSSSELGLCRWFNVF